MTATPKIILASSSLTRQTLLRHAGIVFAAIPSGLNEDLIKGDLQDQGVPVENIVLDLAEAKAQKIASKYPDSYIIGVDQILVLGNEHFSKPKDMNDARAQLLKLRGAEHRLVTGMMVMHGNQRMWHYIDHAYLTMREFSDSYLDYYLRQAGDSILGAVGAYHLEGLGAQLFSKIKGDYFTVLGLPLVPLLGFLADNHLLPAE